MSQTPFSEDPPAPADPHGPSHDDPVDLLFSKPGEWIVLHTRTRQEKSLALDLAARQIPHFLPLCRRIRYHGGRKAVVEEPLFSNYLFLKGSKDDAFLADRTKRVANIIRCPDQKKIAWELRNIYMALSQDAPLASFPSLIVGIRVEVRAGPFRGLQGVIEDRKKGSRLILQVETLGQAVSLDVDASLLDVVE